ncbi:MAG: SAM-dependent methyltransferase, partial [Chloroflexota bacterium]|nr:SAM-dependent methyltransferase [Chloroflexota bacterium]
SNEYLDAFAVHQVNMTSNGLKEVYVGLEGDDLVEVTGELSDLALARRFTDLGAVLVEGQTAEVNLSLDEWAQDVSAALEHGFVLTIDYGRTGLDLYDSDARAKGTLVTYHQHIQTDAPLTMIGNQDITAQVDFTSVIKAGEKVGLNALGLVTQSEFLFNLNLDMLQQRLASQTFSPRQMQANRAGILDLVRPGGLGDFKILAQGKKAGSSKLWGMERSEAATSLLENLPVPLLTGQHLPLADGRSGGSVTESGVFWTFPEFEPLNEGESPITE